MKIVATMPVRNEAWVLGLTLRAALMWLSLIHIWLRSAAEIGRAHV